ncbi:MAG: 23S rRNA (guanosine(2251)-2'-O)-methyltransferase RlmB [Bacteroidales bacterium]|nr:23S rRNA (guanosine(2251)-2'-O)-methyltransferase RlmB [Bacteroidales bacterium]
MKKDKLIYGIRPVIEAIRSGKEIDKLLIQKGMGSNRLFELNKLIKDFSIPYQYVPVEKLNRITNQNHQGIICFISPITYQNIENILPYIYEQGKVPLIIILDKITDVRNLGAIARTAECAGVNVIIVPSRGSAQINADAIKTSAGALYTIPVHRSDNLKLTIDFLKKSGVRIVAATEKAKKYYNSVDLTLPTAIILGSEENGISGEYLKISDHLIKIPVFGKIESLNVSVAAGIIIYETIKQRLG